MITLYQSENFKYYWNYGSEFINRFEDDKLIGSFSVKEIDQFLGKEKNTNYEITFGYQMALEKYKQLMLLV